MKRRVFIVGSGASLLDEPLEKLDGEDVFGVGQALAQWDESPLTYTMYGFHAIEEQRPNDEFAKALGVPLYCGWQAGDKQAYKTFPDGYKMVYRDHTRPLHDGFIGDVDGSLSWAAHSVSVGLAIGVQTAIWLGYKHIGLLGHDFNPKGYVSALDQPRGGDPKAIPMWEPGGRRIREITAALETLRDECEARGIELVNYTCRTAENVLERRSLHAL